MWIQLSTAPVPATAPSRSLSGPRPVLRCASPGTPWMPSIALAICPSRTMRHAHRPRGAYNIFVPSVPRVVLTSDVYFDENTYPWKHTTPTADATVASAPR
eukprot:2484222-Pleurochrysis_carterae.AAC.1